MKQCLVCDGKWIHQVVRDYKIAWYICDTCYNSKPQRNFTLSQLHKPEVKKRVKQMYERAWKALDILFPILWRPWN